MAPNATKVRSKTIEIQQFILEHVEKHPENIAAITANRFDISRQAVNRHLQQLVQQEALAISGTTRNKKYQLKESEVFEKTYNLKGLEEDRVWSKDIAPKLIQLNLKSNVYDIWHYGFTEMLNNAIEHSGGTEVIVTLDTTAAYTKMLIIDNGEGIFRKISRLIDLEDERYAVLELAKGKLTTDPANHSGEGIFFASRMFDDFAIISGNIMFSHEYDADEDWILENKIRTDGTTVVLQLNHNTNRTSKEVFDNYTSGDDYGFVKTVIPVHLAQYENEKLISRSQARRVLTRVDRFKIVIFDFEGVQSIGQAFADEIFRVFKKQRPEIQINYTNANLETEAMIKRALNYA